MVEYYTEHINEWITDYCRAVGNELKKHQLDILQKQVEQKKKKWSDVEGYL